MSEVEAYLPSTKTEGTYVCNYTKIEDWLQVFGIKMKSKLFKAKFLILNQIF